MSTKEASMKNTFPCLMCVGFGMIRICDRQHTHLHTNNSIDKENHGDQQSHIGQGLRKQIKQTQRHASVVIVQKELCMLVLIPDLKRFDKCPKQRTNSLPFAKQLDQSHHTEQTEEGDGDARAVLRTLKNSKIKKKTFLEILFICSKFGRTVITQTWGEQTKY